MKFSIKSKWNWVIIAYCFRVVFSIVKTDNTQMHFLDHGTDCKPVIVIRWQPWPINLSSLLVCIFLFHFIIPLGLGSRGYESRNKATAILLFIHFLISSCFSNRVSLLCTQRLRISMSPWRLDECPKHLGQLYNVLFPPTDSSSTLSSSFFWLTIGLV